MIVIELLRKAPYLKGDVKAFVGADMYDQGVDKNKLAVETFTGKSIGRSQLAISFNMNLGVYRWDETYMDDKEFRALIPKCAIKNDQNKIIKTLEEINFNDVDEPFFCNDDMTITMTRGQAILDETNPRHKVIAAFFFADTDRFIKIEGDGELLFSSQTYSIGKSDIVENSRTKVNLAEMNIGGAVAKMGRQQLLIAAMLWDLTGIKNDTSDDMIRARIYDAIKLSPITLGPKSKAAWFSKFVVMDKDTIIKYGQFAHGVRNLFISKNEDQAFVFGGEVLGKNADQAVAYLSEAHNGPTYKKLKEANNRKNKVKEIPVAGLYELETGIKDDQEPVVPPAVPPVE